MQVQRGVGLQWKLITAQLAVTAAGTAVVAAVFVLMRHLHYPESTALFVGVAAGLVVALCGSILVYGLTRSIKLRLWEAGDLAARIARGDLTHRLTPGPADELGWLEEQLNAMAHHLSVAVADLQSLAEQNRRLAEEAGRGAALEERTRLARELHDTVNQQLFALSMGIATARRRIERWGDRQTEPPQFGAALYELEKLAQEAHGQIRELILHLRPTRLEQQGLAATLKEYAQRLAAKEGWQLTVQIDDSVDLPPSLREHLFRVAQEALNNISKHADADTVHVTLTAHQDGVLLHIADDGRGFDPSRPVRPTAVGLIGMRERLESFDGELEVQSREGEGTHVRAFVPWPPTPKE